MAWSTKFDPAKAGADQTVITTYEYSGDNPFPEINHVELRVPTISVALHNQRIGRILRNTVPTHDPYTNPNAEIYYECGCGAVLDPGTKSFAALNNAASREGWKVRFGPLHYIPYCPKCAAGVW